MLTSGRKRRWDMVKAHSSVGIVLYHADEDAFIVVRQFRPAVSLSGPSAASAAAKNIFPVAEYSAYGEKAVQALLNKWQSCEDAMINSLGDVSLAVQVYASRWMEAQAEGKPAPPLSTGFTYELTAGIIDKNKSHAEIAKEEVRNYVPVLSQNTQNTQNFLFVCEQKGLGRSISSSTVLTQSMHGLMCDIASGMA